MLFDDMDVPLGEEVELHRVLQPRVEAEIGFIFGRDIDQAMPTTTDILRATDCVVAAIEIVGSRLASWDIRIVDTLADNASSGLFVLGHRIGRLADIDIVDCGMSLDRGGRLVSTGTGRACLGSPISAVVWLARAMASLAGLCGQGMWCCRVRLGRWCQSLLVTYSRRGSAGSAPYVLPLQQARRVKGDGLGELGHAVQPRSIVRHSTLNHFISCEIVPADFDFNMKT